MKPAPRFNHVAMSVPAELLEPKGRDELLAFFGEVFGWTQMPTMSEAGKLLVLRAYRNDQFVFLAGSQAPMRCNEQEHFGMSVATPEMLDEMYSAARAYQARDPRVELIERHVDDFGAVKLHAFYVRYQIPMWLEVQCFEWARGVNADSLPS